MADSEAVEYPPTTTLPADFGPSSVLIRASRIVLHVGELRLWPSSCSFSVILVLHPSLAAELGPHAEANQQPVFEQYPRDYADQLVKLTVTLADGQMRSNHPEAADSQRLKLVDGRSHNGWNEATFWFAPLPPDPDMTIAAEWLGAGVSGSRRLPTTALREQASQAAWLW